MGLALIGYGEAGRGFSRAAGWKDRARVFDIAHLNDAYAEDGVTGYTSAREALDGAAIILSLVTADQSRVVAEEAALHIAPGSLYCDMNSVAPDTKRASARVIEAAGGRYVDVAIMAPVQPAQLAVPMLTSGPHAEAGAAALAAQGFVNVRPVGDDVGRASTIKMLRSVMYKGVEALTAECLIACVRAGVTEEVLASFNNDWSEQADYRLDRMLAHGTRRAAEMEEVAKTLMALGVAPLMTRGTAQRQAELGAKALAPVPAGLNAKLKRLSA